VTGARFPGNAGCRSQSLPLERRMEMTVKNLIEKYRLSLFVKDGVDMVRFGRRPGAKDLAELKSRKGEIVEELKTQIAERQAAIEAKRNAKRAEYVANSDLRRCLAVSVDENLNVTRAVITLVFVERDGELRAFRPNYGLENPRFLEHETDTMARIVAERERTPYGFSGNAFEISEEEEVLLLEEQTVAACEAEKALAQAMEEATKKAAREATEKVAEMEAKFAEAKRTGNPVEFDRWSEPCDGSVVECDVDIIIWYAMPDGSVKVERIHTH
jgi:hypothetical protein